MPARQSGGYPVFEGGAYQRGRGFGSIMSSLFRNLLLPAARRYAVPAAKNLGKSIVKAGARKSAKVLGSVAQGKSLKQAIREEMLGTQPPPRQYGQYVLASPQQPKRRKPAKKRPASGGIRRGPPGKRSRTEPQDIWSKKPIGRSV